MHFTMQTFSRSSRHTRFPSHVFQNADSLPEQPTHPICETWISECSHSPGAAITPDFRDIKRFIKMFRWKREGCYKVCPLPDLRSRACKTHTVMQEKLRIQTFFTSPRPPPPPFASPKAFHKQVTPMQEEFRYPSGFTDSILTHFNISFRQLDVE